MKIEILSTEHIRPSSPTPSHLRDFKLSFLDERIPPCYIPLLLYYKFDKNVDKSEMSRRLKTSLSDALVKFYPLAGRMKGQILVDCNDQGILYIEAGANGKVSDVLESPDSSVLDTLVPFKSNGYLSSAEEQVAIQITSFNCGGISIGICISHRISDGYTLCSFINCWAAMARGDDHSKILSPVFNSATLFPPLNTPDFKPNFKSPCVQPLVVKLVMRRFTFTSSTIDDLKQQVSKISSIVKQPSRVEVLSAFLWSRLMAAKGREKSGKSIACHPVSLRGKISDLSENSFGNLFQMISAENDGETNWIELAEKLRVAFGEIDSEYVNKLLGEKGSDLAKENFMEVSKYLRLGDYEVLRFSSYCGFPFNEADFGWGRPVWLSSSSISIKDTINMFDSVGSSGGVEVWIVLPEEEMERLEQELEPQLKEYQMSPCGLDNIG